MAVRKYFPGMVIGGWRLVDREVALENYRWEGICVTCGIRRFRTITNFWTHPCKHTEHVRHRNQQARHIGFVKVFKAFGSLYGDVYHQSIATHTLDDLVRKIAPLRVEPPFSLERLSTDPTWTSRPKGGKGYWPGEGRDAEDVEADEEEDEETGEEDDLPRGEPLPPDPKDANGFTHDENTMIFWAKNFDAMVAECKRRGERLEVIVERMKSVGMPEHIVYRRLGIYREAPSLENDEERSALLETEHRLYMAARRKLREPLPFNGKYQSLRSLPRGKKIPDHVAIQRFQQTKEELIRRHWLSRYVSGEITIDGLPVDSLGHLTHRLAKLLTKKRISSVGDLLKGHARGALYDLGVLDIQRITALFEEYDLFKKEEDAGATA